MTSKTADPMTPALFATLATVVALSASSPQFGVVVAPVPDTTASAMPAADSNERGLPDRDLAVMDSGALGAHLVFKLAPQTDTVRRRPQAIEVSDAYETRLRIHRYASYTMIPLFALQSIAGNQLYEADRTGGEKPSWAKSTHVAGATGLAALFTVNTVTGAWNLWESRSNPSGRTKRWIHSILMLASDAGFTYSGISSGDAEHSQTTRDHHRNVSYAAMGTALAGYAVMLIGDH